MNRREFLKNGAKSLRAEDMSHNFPGVSLLGYGCMRWPMKDGEVDQEAVNEMVDYAIEHGVNFFDSAPIYLQGKSERATAKALLRHPRESYLISTKCSNFRGPYSFEQGEQMYRQSLENFETSCLDYYILHNVATYAAFKERFEDTGLADFFVKEREAGRIRHLGFSFHGSTADFQDMLSLHSKYHWDFVLIQMNYVDWSHSSREGNASDKYYMLSKLGIPVLIMEPLLGGRLADIPAPLADMLKSRKPSDSVASWAFRFDGTFPNVLSVLSGMTCMEHLRDNLETFIGLEKLSPDEFELLKNVADKMSSYPLVKCTNCKYCMPCPYGINIPEIFRFYNDSVKEGTYVVGREQKNYSKEKRRFLKSYNEAVPTLRQADHCIGCGACLSLCPQQIDIPNQLFRIDSYIEKLKQDKL